MPTVRQLVVMSDWEGDPSANKLGKFDIMHCCLHATSVFINSTSFCGMTMTQKPMHHVFFWDWKSQHSGQCSLTILFPPVVDQRLEWHDESSP
jgi:hypothetical protein